MNTKRIRKAAELSDIYDMVRYALRAETGIEDEEVRREILAKAGSALIFNAGDSDPLANYLRNVAFAEDMTPTS